LGGKEFAALVQTAAEMVLGPLSRGQQVRTRPSSQGRYTAVTLEVWVADAQQVLAVYQALRQVPGLAILI
jgi:putative lipoic acid-binding regulatory protein